MRFAWDGEEEKPEALSREGDNGTLCGGIITPPAGAGDQKHVG